MLVVLGVVMSVMAVMPAALAHHPELTIGGTCYDVSGTSSSWCSDSGNAGCSHPNINIEIRWYIGGSWQAWTHHMYGAYNAGNGFQFDFGPIAWAPGATRFDARATAVGPWGNGSAGGQVADVNYLSKPVCPSYVRVCKETIPDGSTQSFNLDLDGDGEQGFTLKDGECWTSKALTTAYDNMDIDENSVSGWSWDTSLGGCDQGESFEDIDIDVAGETVTCTVYNVLQKGRIIVDKVTLPSGDTTQFEFDLAGDGQPNFFLADGSTPRDSGWLSPGTYDLDEVNIPSGWYLDSEVCSDGSDPDSIRLAAGETVTCTFTNIKKGQIIVDKVTNPSTETDFGFEASWVYEGGHDFWLDDTDAPHNSGWLLPGEYDVYESYIPSGWMQNSAVCDHDETVGDIDLGPGEIITCTFTNGPSVGHIVIDKVTVPSGDSQSFEFNPSWSGTNFFLTDQGAPVDATVNPGKYSIVEIVPSGWDLSSAVCDQGETIGDIDVAAGETVTCTFTNTKLGRITVDKVTDPAGDTTAFGINTSWAGEFNLHDLDVPYDSFWTLMPGSGFSVSEDADPKWALTSASCVGTVQGPIANLAGFTLNPGERIDCVFDNYRIPTGKLTIVKDATPGDDTPFSFTGTYTGGGVVPARAAHTLTPFELRDPSDPAITLPEGPGAYVVTEGALGAGWQFDDIVCTGTEAWSHDGQTLSVTVDRDDQAVCYFYNSGYGHLVVKKVVSAGSPAASFAFSSNYAGGFSLAGGAQTAAIEVPAGVYSVSETLTAEQIADGWALASANCSDGSAVGAIGVAAGETVTCTFQNTYQMPPGYLRVVKVVDGGSAVCSDFSFQLDGDPAVAFDASCANVFELPAGSSHWVVETGPADDYTAGYDNCSAVEIVAGETAVCTITNTYGESPGTSLTIVKAARTLNTALESALFAFSGDLGEFSLASGDSQPFNVEPGTYAVTELLVDPWALDPAPTGIVCSGAAEGAVVYDQAAGTVTVTLAEGDNVTCTFNNYDEDTLGPELPYTGSQPFTMPLLIAGLWAVLMGLALGVWGLMRQTEKS